MKNREKVSGGAVARVTISKPSGTSQSRPVTMPSAPTRPSAGPHISSEVRADLGNLDPELAAGVRRVADTK